MLRKQLWLLAITLITLVVVAAGCVSSSEHAQTQYPSAGSNQAQTNNTANAMASSSSAQQTSSEQEQVASTVLVNEAVEFGKPYTTEVKATDGLYINVTADKPVNCYVVDDTAYKYIMERNANGDMDGHILAKVEETTEVKHLFTFNQTGTFHLVMIPSDQGNMPSYAHLQMVLFEPRGESSASSASDDAGASNINTGQAYSDSAANHGTQGVDDSSGQGNQGTQGVSNTYTIIDTDFSAADQTTGLMYGAAIHPGDTVEAEATSNIPVDFISGDAQFYQNYLMGYGNVDSFMNDGMQKGNVYQDESYSGATYYSLNQVIDRDSFNLVIRNINNDQSLKGHIKIVVHSQYASPASASSY